VWYGSGSPDLEDDIEDMANRGGHWCFDCGVLRTAASRAVLGSEERGNMHKTMTEAKTPSWVGRVPHLKPGKYADLVVLSKDILTMPEDEIPTAHVVYTIVGGKVRYQRPDAK